MNERIGHLKDRMLGEERFVSIEQARIITRVYQENEARSTAKKRALALKTALEEMKIAIDPEELIVGNRTKGVRAGVVFPESGCSWVDKEFEDLPTRPQDRFQVNEEDIREFRETIYPYWKTRSMEEDIRNTYGKEIDAISRVVKINQKDHAQGHICPDVERWLSVGPAALRQITKSRLYLDKDERREFYECVLLVLDGAITFMHRYAKLADRMSTEYPEHRETLRMVAENCRNLASRPAQTYWEALQSLWFLFVILLSVIAGNPLPTELLMLMTSPALLCFYLVIVGICSGVLVNFEAFLGFSSRISNTVIAMPGSFADFIINIRNSSLIPSIRTILIVGLCAFVVMLVLTMFYYRFLAFDFVKTGKGEILVDDIIRVAGGPENIINAGSGLFKLNVYIRDPEKINYEKIQDIGIRKVVETRNGLTFELGTSCNAIARRINKKLIKETA